MGTEKKFLTFQTVARYESALLRHAQFCRWTRVYVCPCVTKETGQPDVHCNVCKGRGEIYKAPGPFRIIDEAVPHDDYGRVFIKYKNYINGSLQLYKTVGDGVHAVQLLDPVQPLDKSYVQMLAPYLRKYEKLYANYQFDPDMTVIAENCAVVQPNILYAHSTAVAFKGRTYHGSISGVSRVRNVTRSLNYQVDGFAKEFIYLNNMLNYVAGDVLEVDYTYQAPYPLLIHSVSQKRRYESAYVLDQADAVCQSYYYYDIRPNDLITSLAMEIPGVSIIDPRVSGPSGADEVTDAFDVARITGIVDSTGTEYNVAESVILIGRNQIKWLGTKPLIKYTVQFLYNPSFVGLTTYDTARFSENKSFVNRINVMLRERMTKEVTF